MDTDSKRICKTGLIEQVYETSQRGFYEFVNSKTDVIFKNMLNDPIGSECLPRSSPTAVNYLVQVGDDR